MTVTPTWFGNRRHYGAGKLFAAPLGTVTSAYAPVASNSVFTLGTSATTVPGSTAWLPLGWTDDGHTFSQSSSTDDDKAAESYYPVASPVTEIKAKWAVKLKTVNLTNLRLALNGFDSTSSLVTNVSGSGGQVPGASTVVRVKPAVAGAELRCQLLFVSTEQDMVIVIYKAFNAGDLELAFKKGADGLSLPLDFNLEIPDASIATTPYDILVTGADYVESASGE